MGVPESNNTVENIKLVISPGARDMVGCEIRSPSDDVHGYKVLTCWYTHEAIDSCVQSLRKGAPPY